MLGLVVSVVSPADGPGPLAEDEQALRAAGVGADGPALLAFFKRQALSDADRARLPRLIEQLGDDEFDVRERASAGLLAVGPRAVPLLRQAARGPDREVSRRAEECLRKLEADGQTGGPAVPVLSAAARLLAARKPDGAAAVLLDYLPFAEDETVVAEVETALAAVALREGKAEPALVRSLTDAAPLRRGVAGAALARAGVAEHRDAVRKLLQDPDLAARQRVALALAVGRDREAVPVLIDLLGRLPPEQAWPVEELLCGLAGEKAPAVALGADDAGRAKCRDAWAAWWREHGAALDMTALERPRALLGHTLFVVPDYGTVTEIGRDGKVRWQIGGLGCPFEARVLPGERVLVAEYNGLVTERNLKGEILWQKAVPRALQCQRLANGNTLLVSSNAVVECEPGGKEKVLYTRSGANSLLAARKLRTGQMVVVESGGTCLRLDAAGKELSRFELGRISNNCLEVLPNGNLLVPRFFDAKVVEYDARGQAVWQAAFPSPFTAQRLPNGHTLIACHEPPRVVELDRAGKVVWERAMESANHRPWFASRR
jgi:HEAT repeat protein